MKLIAHFILLGGLVFLSWTSAREIPDVLDTNKSESAVQGDSQDLFQSDIVLTAKQRSMIENAHIFEKTLTSGRSKRKAISFPLNRWPDGVIPYIISPSSVKDASLIEAAITHWEDNTCVNFVPRTTETDYVNVVNQNTCSSSVGRAGGAQPLSIGDSCNSLGSTIHELGHAIGLWHEHSRPDRDNYVTIHRQNIFSGGLRNFDKLPEFFVSTYDVAYDTGSIMHYGPFVFTLNGEPTISAKTPVDQFKLQQPKTGLTAADIEITNLLYPCENQGDTTPPVVTNCPSDISISSTIPCNVGVATAVTWQAPTATDNSGSVTLQGQTHQPGQSFPTGTTVVTYTFGDPSGNTASCSFSVTVIAVDSIPPVCQGIPNDITRTILPDAGSTTVTWTAPQASDNCGPVTLQSSTHTPGASFSVGTTQVTYLFADGSGNTSPCSFSVTIIEPQGCNANQFACQSGKCIASNWKCDTIMDCPDGDDEQGCENQGDTTPPVVTNCPSDISVSSTIPCNVGGATGITWQEPTATDNSGTVNLLSRTHQPGQSFPTGTTVVMYTFADPSGNTASCSFTATVIAVDSIPPVCQGIPNDLTRTILPGTSSTTVTWTAPQATDNCGPVTLQSRTNNPGASFSVGTTQVTYVFADGSGNTVPCSFSITIIGPQGCNANQFQCQSGRCITSNWECDAIVDCPDGDDEQECENQGDTAPPVVTNCPSDISVSSTIPCNVGGVTAVTWQQPTATDNSGSAPVQSRTHQPGQSFPTGTTLVTYTFADPLGNTASCTFSVTVIAVDSIPPVCQEIPNDITRTIMPGSGSATVTWTAPQATDNCGPVTLQSRTHTPGAFFSVGTTQVIYVFVDGSGNTVPCSFSVTIIEPQGCNANQFQCQSGRCIASNWKCDAIVDCPDGDDEQGCENQGDTTPPVVTNCPNDILVSSTIPCNVGGATAVSWQQPAATDNSGSATVQSQTHQPGQSFPTGTTVVTYTFTDPSGNTASCTFSVTVIAVDSIPPVCQGIPNDITRTIMPGTGSATVTWTSPQATDNCGQVTQQSNTHTPGAFFSVGTTQVTYAFVDGSGNTVPCSFSVTIIELLAQACNANQFQCQSGRCIAYNWKCDVIVDCPDGDDEHGCENQGDTTPPVVTNCPSDISVSSLIPCNVGGGTPVTWQQPAATDNSGSVTLKGQTHQPGQSFPTGTTVVTYTFADPSGNTASCSFSLTVITVDSIPPVCQGIPNDITRTILPGAGSTTVMWTAPQATDNCGPVTLQSNTHTPGASFSVGTTQVTYVFVDGSGNTVPCSFSVTIIEPQGCNANQFLCQSGRCITTNWKCDAIVDCPDGDDEQGCGECTTDEFQCLSGKCIPSIWRCDVIVDCPDGDDELCDGT